MNDDDEDYIPLPSGWWLVPGLIFGPFLWWGFFHLIGVLP